MGKPEGLYYKSWAVVIGIENYLLAPKIPGVIEDAKAVAEVLRKLGFEEVVELYDKDASSRRLQQTLVDFLPRKVGRQDRLVIYFSGHAGITQSGTGKDLGYLVPWDAHSGNVSKAVTFEQLKEFSHRSASKHTLFVFDTAVRGWEASAAQALSLEGRSAPEDDTEKRAVQVLTAADKGEAAVRTQDRSVFVLALIKALSGEGDIDKNGWLMASEVGRFISQQVTDDTKGAQHPTFAQLEGDGDTIIIEGRKAAFRLGGEPQSPAERQQAARDAIRAGFCSLAKWKSVGRSLGAPQQGAGIRSDIWRRLCAQKLCAAGGVPDLEEALKAGKLAVEYAPNNPDSHYTLGLIYEKRGQYAEAEGAMRRALAANPSYVDVYFTLGSLYADHLKDQKKAVEAFERYLRAGRTLIIGHVKP